MVEQCLGELFPVAKGRFGNQDRGFKVAERDCIGDEARDIEVSLDVDAPLFQSRN